MKVSCLICTELFDGTRDVAATQCGHTFHSECLLNWFKQSPTCPQCRERIQHKKIIKKLYFTQNDDDEDDGASDERLMNQLQNAQEKLQEKLKKLTEAEVKQASLEMENAKLVEKHRSLESKYQQESSTSKMLKKSLQISQVMAKEGGRAKEEAKSLRTELETYVGIKKLVKDVESDISEMMEQYTDKRQLATWCAVLQKELCAKRLESQRLNKEVMCAKKETSVKKQNLIEKMGELRLAREQQEALTSDLDAAQHKISALDRRLVEASALSQECSTAAKRRRKLSSENSEGCVTKTLKINSSECTSPSEASVLKTTQTTSLTNLPAMGFLQKSRKVDKSSVVRTGYNGLGGHGKLIVPHKKASFDLFCQSRLSTSSKGGKNAPPLPSLPRSSFH